MSTAKPVTLSRDVVPKRNLSDILRCSTTPSAHSNNKVKSTAVLNLHLLLNNDDKVVAFSKLKEIILISCGNSDVKNLVLVKPCEALSPRRKWSMEDVFCKLMKEICKCIKSSIDETNVSTIVQSMTTS